MSAESRPLAGRRILVTRPEETAGELARALEALGAQAVLHPTIEIARVSDHAPLDEALRRLGAFDWVIFTSANGVRQVWRRLEELGLEDALEHGELGRRPGHPRVAAIGPGTAAALERRGVRPDFVPPEYVAEALADGLPDAQGSRILLLRADIARAALRERLSARGASVEDVAAYRTVVGSADRSLEQNPEEKIDVVTFTSPSSVRGYVAAGGRVAPEARVVCIGPVTARAAREAGIAVDAVADRYTIEGLVDAVVHHVQASSTSPSSAGRASKET